MMRYFGLVPVVTAGLLISACDHKSVTSVPVKATESESPALPLVSPSNPNPTASRASNEAEITTLLQDLTAMGSPSKEWAPARVQSFAIRLDRLEWLNKQNPTEANAQSVIGWRDQYDALLIGEAAPTKTPPSSAPCHGLTSEGGASMVHSGAAFNCFNSNVAATEKKDLLPVKPPPAMTVPYEESLARVRDALKWAQQFNPQCANLAAMVPTSKDPHFVLGEALGCYLQIAPVIEDGLATARAINANETAQAFEIELANVDRYRRILERYRSFDAAKVD